MRRVAVSSPEDYPNHNANKQLIFPHIVIYTQN